MDRIAYGARRGKKLIAAARFWAHGGRSDIADAINDLVVMGVDRVAAEAWVKAQAPDAIDEFEVWPINWRAAVLFLDLQTQWRTVGGMGVFYTGLDYAAVWATINNLVVAPQRRMMFRAICIMERAAIPIINASGKG